MLLSRRGPSSAFAWSSVHLPSLSQTTRGNRTGSHGLASKSSSPRRPQMIPAPSVRWRACAAAPPNESEANPDDTNPAGQPAPEPHVTMPRLYDAWFPPGNELAEQMRTAVASALDSGIYKMELKWPCVPNLEEIKFGTKLNMEFGMHVSRELGLSSPEDYPLVKRYLGEFSDLYWAREVGKAFPDRVVWAISSDAINKSRTERNLGNLKLASLRRGRTPDAKDGDVIVAIDPQMTSTWENCAKLQPSPTSPVIFLNSQFNETYGLCGPRKGPMEGTECVYFLRRVTRGYVFRAYPGPWQAILEKPDQSCEVLKTYDYLPKLNEVAQIVREISNDRYGAFNDRYAKGFGGRL